MRAAVIFGLGSSLRALRPFQQESRTEWAIGMPASSSEADAILIFGGDGTVHRHLGQLVRLQLPVLVVPAGSGNDFARALNLRSIRDSVAAWKEFEHGANLVRRIDLGLIRGLGDAVSLHSESEPQRPSPESTRYFCCVAGCGLDSEIAQLANQLPRWLRAHGGYAVTLPIALASFTPVQIKLALPKAPTGNDFIVHTQRPSTLVSVANAPAYGHGMRIAPGALMDDGKLDVCAVGAVGKLRLLRLFPTVYSGKHLAIPEVAYFQAERVRIEAERPLAIYADGEYVCHTPAEVAVAPRALQVISFTVLH